MALIAKDVSSVAQGVENSTKMVVASADEVAKLADSVNGDAVIVEESAKKIETRAEHMVSTTRTVGEGALAVVAAAEKTNEQIKKNIQSRTNILTAISKKYNVKLD